MCGFSRGWRPTDALWLPSGQLRSHYSCTRCDGTTASAPAMLRQATRVRDSCCPQVRPPAVNKTTTTHTGQHTASHRVPRVGNLKLEPTLGRPRRLISIERDGAARHRRQLAHGTAAVPLSFSQILHRPGGETGQPSGGRRWCTESEGRCPGQVPRAHLLSRSTNRCVFDGSAESLRAPTHLHLFRIKGARLRKLSEAFIRRAR